MNNNRDEKAITLQMNYKKPIFNACKYRIKELVESNINDVNIKGIYNVTPLMTVCSTEPGDKKTEIVNLLIDNKAEINAKDDENYNALMLASHKGDAATVQKLLESGADIEVLTKKKDNALTIACKSGECNPKVVKLLIEKCRKSDFINQKNDDGMNALMLALDNSQSDKNEIAEMLFEKGIDVDTTVDKKKTYTIGTTALMIACNNGRNEIVNKLLQKNVNFELRNKDGMNALDFAVKNKHKTIIPMLLHVEDKLKSSKIQKAKI